MENLITDVLVKGDLMYVREAAKDRETIYSEKENARNAKNKKDDKYSIGDLVLKSPYRLGYTAPKKHVALFTGPWKVIGKDEGGIKYIIEQVHGGKMVDDVHRHFFKRLNLLPLK